MKKICSFICAVCILALVIPGFNIARAEMKTEFMLFLLTIISDFKEVGYD